VIVATPLRRLFTVVNGGTPTPDEHNWDGGIPWITPEDLSDADGGRIGSSRRTLTRAGIVGSNAIVSPAGSLVVSTRAPIGYVAELTVSAATNQGCRTLVPRVDMDVRFFRYAILSIRANLVARGQGSTFRELSSSALASSEVPAPDTITQQAIADYLDRETARIDRLVDNTQRQLRLVTERRTAVRDGAFIHRRQWRLKRLLRAPMAYGVLVPEFVEPGSGVPMIRTYNLTDRGNVDSADLPEIPKSLADDYQRTKVAAGDLILSVVGSMGRAAVVSNEVVGANLNRPLARLQPRRELPARLLWHWTQTTIFADMARLATGASTAQPTLNLGDLANFDVGLPAQTQHWGPLLGRLEDICDELDRVEDGLKRQVALHHERRQALITAAVTGQMHVLGPA